MDAPVTAEDRPKRSLADDPSFLASLSELDRGIADERSPRKKAAPARAPAPLAATTGPSPPEQPQPPSPSPGSARGPRRLLDLFPPDTTTASLPDQHLQPLFDRLQPLSDRRPIPWVDAPQQINPRVEPRQTTHAPTYETFYGLHERPFSLSSDPRFLYHSAAYDRAAQAVLDAIHRRDGIVVLTGEVGVGKTMLCRAVTEQLDRRTLTSFVVDPFAAPEDLLKTVLVDFGVISRGDLARGRLAQASHADLSAALRDFLFSLAPLQAFAVIIVDEAQNLSVELLEQMRVFAEMGGDEQLLQLMLVGQPALSATLAKPGLRQLARRVSARSSLGPLASDEVAGYVVHRLGVVGSSPRVEFDDPSIARLYELSGGVPRIVNLLCDRALAVGHAASASTIDERMVESAAKDLDLAPLVSRRSLARIVATFAVLALLVIIGAAAGAFVFRTGVSALISKWQAAPAPPVEPRPTLPPPFEPAPPSGAEQQILP